MILIRYQEREQQDTIWYPPVKSKCDFDVIELGKPAVSKRPQLDES
jgi:hypothetical protein